MTVTELIKELEKMPQDKVVALDGCSYCTVEGVFYNEKLNCVMIVD